MVAARLVDSDKYNRGVVGLATGSPAFPGAALMSVAGALAGPIGMVRYAGAVADDVIRAYPSVVAARPGRGRRPGAGVGVRLRPRHRPARAPTSCAPCSARRCRPVIDADALTLLGRGGPGLLAAPRATRRPS